MEIIGVQRSTGTYEGKAFAGYRLFLTGTKSNVTGKTCETHYLKDDVADPLMKACGGILDDLIGKNVELYFNQYHKVAKVEVMK